MSRRLKLSLNCIRSLWYLAHGFTGHSEKNILSVKGRRCLLKYNSKGVQAEHVISPIELKQLAVPFTIHFVGYFLATTAFIGELIYHKFVGRRATGNKVTVLKDGDSKNKPVPHRQRVINKKAGIIKVRAAPGEGKTKEPFIQNVGVVVATKTLAVLHPTRPTAIETSEVKKSNLIQPAAQTVAIKKPIIQNVAATKTPAGLETPPTVVVASEVKEPNSNQPTTQTVAIIETRPSMMMVDIE